MTFFPCIANDLRSLITWNDVRLSRPLKKKFMRDKQNLLMPHRLSNLIVNILTNNNNKIQTKEWRCVCHYASRYLKCLSDFDDGNEKQCIWVNMISMNTISLLYAGKEIDNRNSLDLIALPPVAQGKTHLWRATITAHTDSFSCVPRVDNQHLVRAWKVLTLKKI